jgi:hypothetical protein
MKRTSCETERKVKGGKRKSAELERKGRKGRVALRRCSMNGTAL